MGLDTVTTIVNLVSAVVPMWAVFTSEEGEPEIWTERVHLWAHTRTGLSQDEKASRKFLDPGDDLPSDDVRVQGMTLDEGHLVLVEQSEFVFLGYSEVAELKREDWLEQVPSSRRAYRRRVYGE
ncbi:MAG: hypothetical protein JO138_02790 [Acidobacteriaceae bacterium]|nr:hypothetical protein [Acidobacteriaceae bacterium]